MYIENLIEIIVCSLIQYFIIEKRTKRLQFSVKMGYFEAQLFLRVFSLLSSMECRKLLYFSSLRYNSLARLVVSVMDCARTHTLYHSGMCSA